MATPAKGDRRRRFREETPAPAPRKATTKKTTAKKTAKRSTKGKK